MAQNWLGEVLEAAEERTKDWPAWKLARESGSVQKKRKVMCGDGIWISRDVRWTIVPRDDGQWEVRRVWREIFHQWQAPPGEWNRKPTLLFRSLEDALCAMGQEYKSGVTIPRGIQIKLGPTVS